MKINMMAKINKIGKIDVLRGFSNVSLIEDPCSLNVVCCLHLIMLCTQACLCMHAIIYQLTDNVI